MCCLKLGLDELKVMLCVLDDVARTQLPAVVSLQSLLCSSSQRNSAWLLLRLGKDQLSCFWYIVLETRILPLLLLNALLEGPGFAFFSCSSGEFR